MWSSAIRGGRLSPGQTGRLGRHGRSGRARTYAVTAAAAFLGLMALAPGAAASGSPQGPPAGPTTAPFTQCPAIGLDTSCEFLVDVTTTNPASDPLVLRDSSQNFYDGGDDVTVAVQNDSSAPLSSIHLGIKGSGADSFGFDGDGLCNPPTGPSPEGCPFGPPGDNETPFDYYGPDAEFTIDPETFDSGNVVFPIALQPGQYTYFSLEANPFGGVYVTAGTANNAIGSTLSDPANTEVLPSSTIALPAPANITDQATINGPNSAFATGTVTYRVYSDPGCTKEVSSSKVTITTEGIIPPSEPVGEKLPTNANYYWMVEYSGNEGEHPNSKSASYCGNEVMTFGTPPVTAGTVSTSLVASNGVSGAQITVPPSTAVHDTATVAGQPQSGRVTYYVFSDSTCTAQIKTPLGGGVASNGAFPPSANVTLPVGTYYFQAAYSGSAGVAGSRSPCGSEVLTVATPPPPPPPPVPNSGYTIQSIVGHPNGTVTITFVPAQSGEATLVVTVPTASIARASAVDAKAKRCKHGQIKIKGKCAPPTTVAGSTSANATAGVPLTLTVNLSSKIKALLKKGKTIHLTATLTYKSSLGGTPTVQTLQVTVKGKRAHHHK